jgi:hypothetical protein
MDFRGIWTIADFADETITLEGKDCSHQHSVRVFACKDTTFWINDKIKASMFEGCVGCTIHISEQVAPIELVNCKRCKIFAHKSMPFAMFEKSSDCVLNLFQETRKCTISTNSSTTIKMKYPKEGVANDSELDEDWCHFSIPEIYETRVLDENKAETTAYMECE